MGPTLETKLEERKINKGTSQLTWLIFIWTCLTHFPCTQKDLIKPYFKWEVITEGII